MSENTTQHENVPFGPDVTVLAVDVSEHGDTAWFADPRAPDGVTLVLTCASNFGRENPPSLWWALDGTVQGALPMQLITTPCGWARTHDRFEVPARVADEVQALVERVRLAVDLTATAIRAVPYDGAWAHPEADAWWTLSWAEFCGLVALRLESVVGDAGLMQWAERCTSGSKLECAHCVSACEGEADARFGPSNQSVIGSNPFTAEELAKAMRYMRGANDPKPVAEVRILLEIEPGRYKADHDLAPDLFNGEDVTVEQAVEYLREQGWTTSEGFFGWGCVLECDGGSNRLVVCERGAL